MNLYLICWNLQKKMHRAAFEDLVSMRKVFPGLDSQNAWYESSDCGKVFAASMSSNEDYVQPRKYVAKLDKHLILYSGLPVDITENFRGHDAASLGKNWDRLFDSLEGQYFISRISTNPPSIEIITDKFGYEQSYYSHHNDIYVICNSVYLIEKITHFRSLDALGTSFLLSLGKMSGNRTLRENIRAIPPSEHWLWKDSGPKRIRKRYYSISNLTAKKRTRINTEDIKSLSESLVRIVKILNQYFGELHCTLTGGRDSRLLTALLFHSKIKAKYFTMGEPDSIDVQTADQIARLLKLSYDVIPVSSSKVLSNWDRACSQLIRQTDGMRKLSEIGGIVAYLDKSFRKKNVTLWGVGGEFARRLYCGYPPISLGRKNIFSKITEKDIQHLIISYRMNNYDGLVKQDAIRMVISYIKTFVAQCLDDGINLLDIPDIFYLYAIERRRNGNNARGLMEKRDSFSPFFTRSYIEMAFSLPAAARFAQNINFALQKYLLPDLDQISYTKGPWPIQNPVINLLFARGKMFTRGLIGKFLKKNKFEQIAGHKKITGFDRLNWLESKCQKIRELCLSQSNSEIWNLVDRSLFEKITDPDFDHRLRARYLEALFSIAQLGYYEMYERRNSQRES